MASLIFVFSVVALLSGWFMFSSATGLAAVGIAGGLVIATLAFGVSVYFGGLYISSRYWKVIGNNG